MSWASPNPSPVPGGRLNLNPAENQMYSAFYQQLDPAMTGSVPGAMVATKLKLSGLPTNVLGQIWTMADTNKQGKLNKEEFFTALKLTALAQNSIPLTLDNLNMSTPLPSFDGSNNISRGTPPPLPAQRQQRNDNGWQISQQEKQMSDQIFYRHNPQNGKLAGGVVRQIFMEYGLPTQKLAQIWSLSDVDADGLLDSEEFAVAIHLLNMAKVQELPSALPTALIPPGHRGGRGAPMGGNDGVVGAADWVVSPPDKQMYDNYFNQADGTMSGVVTGAQVMGIFQQSKLPQSDLAAIWGLVDFHKSGKLDKDQFALAMYLIKCKTQGQTVPQPLPPLYIPPLWRQKLQMGGAASNMPKMTIHDSGEELEQIREEIESLNSRRIQLEQEIKDKELRVATCTEEVGELEREVQEAQSYWQKTAHAHQSRLTKIADLERQKVEYERLISDIQNKAAQENNAINDLKTNVLQYNSSVREKEGEMKRANEQLATLKAQQTQLANQVELNYKELDTVSKRIETTKSEIDRIKMQIDKEQKINAQAAEELNRERNLLAAVTNNSVSAVGSDDPFNTKGGQAHSSSSNDAWGSDPFANDPFADSSAFPKNEFKDPFAVKSGLSEKEQIQIAMQASMKRELTAAEKEEIDLKAAMEASLRDK